MDADREFWEEFLNIYRLNPCIWDTKSKQYADKNLRNDAYQQLVEKCKGRFSNANKDFVVKKIHTIRCSFRRELKKVLASQKSGNSTEDVYIPHLWYYNIISFIRDLEIPPKGKSNLDNEEDESINSPGGNNTQEEGFEDTQDTVLDVISDLDASVPSPNIRPESTISAISSTPSTKRRKVSQEKQFLNVATETLTRYNANNEHRTATHIDDQFDTIGKKVAFDLRSLKGEQLIFTEKLISDVVYYAKLHKLNENFTVNINESRPIYSQQNPACNINQSGPLYQSLNYGQNVSYQPNFSGYNVQHPLTTSAPPPQEARASTSVAALSE